MPKKKKSRRECFLAPECILYRLVRMDEYGLVTPEQFYLIKQHIFALRSLRAYILHNRKKED